MKEIFNNIEKNIWNAFENQSDIGLLTGLSGMALFYDYAFLVYDTIEYHDKLISIIEKINNLIETQTTTCSFCSGFAGYGWLLSTISKDVVAIDEDYFKDLDELLFEGLKKQELDNKYDFLHGANGVMMYFLERYKTRKDDFMKNLIFNFSKNLLQKIENDIEKVLEETRGFDSDKCYYFGIAHGVSGLMNFLIHLHNSILNKEINILPSLKKCLNFLEKNKKFDAFSKQYYPNTCNLDFTDIDSSRLSWCQGDLGVSNALFNVGTFMKDNELIKESLFLLESTKKIKLADSFVRDFGFCHGSIGIMIQYQMMSERLKIDNKESIDYWKSVLEFQTNDYNTFLSYQNLKYNNDATLIFGTVGLGLSILSLDKKIDSQWLECFNLF